MEPYELTAIVAAILAAADIARPGQSSTIPQYALDPVRVEQAIQAAAAIIEAAIRATPRTKGIVR
jgi:hypothetical protein